MTSKALSAFSLLDPLPDGHLALEASAGTGKTYTLAALATRLLAETDTSVAELLVVTFTRAATAELRARIRDRLVTAAEHLAAESAAPSDDPLLNHLAATDTEQRQARAVRLQRAVTDFDAATITTIHGFAAQVLTTLGLDAGVDVDATLTDDDDALVADACADVLAAAAVAGRPAGELPTHRKLAEVATAMLAIPDLAVAPAAGQEGASAADLLLVDLAARVHTAIEDRRRREATMSFDDLLTTLRDALDPRRSGHEVVRTALRDRFRVALIDEFQDTDPVQWDIFSTLFAPDVDSEPSLVLVGDPKQAIYAFRGANIHTYLVAVGSEESVERRSLGTNWRSDGAVLDGLDVLLSGATFGDPDIAFHRVDAPDEHRDRRITLRDRTPLPALSIRLALGDDIERATRKPHDLDTRQAERAIYRDLVTGVRELLDDAAIPDASSATGTRPVHPGDIAVLVRTGIEATRVQLELIEQGVPAVLSRGSVLESPAAEQWRWLLEGLQRPSDPRRARTAALSWFGGRDADWVAAASDDELGEFQEQLAEWAETLQRHGVVAFVRRLWAESDVMARVLRRRDGDRAVTDLDHIGQLLQTTAGDGRTSVAGLLSALDSEPDDDPNADLDSDLVARRIESEAEAVTIMTVWVAKGLQFPIVCVPTMWRHRNPKAIYLDPTTGARTLDVSNGNGWPDKAGAAERKRLANQEATGENLRLLYVALTRAQHHTMLWWTRARGSAATGLARVLFARDPDGHIDPAAYGGDKVALPDDRAAAAALAPLVERSAGCMEVRVVGGSRRPPDRWSAATTDVERPDLTIATLDRVPDRSLRRWSFSSISSRAVEVHADPYDTSLSDRGAADETTPDEVPAAGTDEGKVDIAALPSPGPVSPLAALPAGTAFGTFVHSVLEHVDFAADDLPTAVLAAVDEQQGWRSIDLTPVRAAEPDEPAERAAAAADGTSLLVDGLVGAIRTPLGPLTGGRALCDFGRTDRLDEVEFQLRLGERQAPPSDRDIGALLLEHLDEDDPCHGWATTLAGGAFEVVLAGHLTGSIDAVLRVRSNDGPPRYVVVDYKTNRLHAAGVGPTQSDYRAASLAGAMVDHHYPLQILLYSVALHRFLRWRQPDYDPTVHLGGALYLFVRGMTGPDVAVTNGHPDGVFSWAVPPQLVTELSDLLDGRVATGSTS